MKNPGSARTLRGMISPMEANVSILADNQKTCNTCGELKDLNEFPWRSIPKQSKHSRCKECYNRDQGVKKAAAAGREYIPQISYELGLPANTRRCVECSEIKDDVEFKTFQESPKPNSRKCKKCRYELGRQKRLTSTAKFSEKRKQYKARLKSRTDHQIIEDRLRLRTNGTKRCRTCTHELAFDLFHSVRSEPDGLASVCIKCTAIRVSRQELEKKLGYFNDRGLHECVYCGGPYEHKDHVMPLNHEGPDDSKNLVPACARCNLSKGAMDPWSWLERCFPNQDHEALLDLWGVDWRAWPS